MNYNSHFINHLILFFENHFEYVKHANKSLNRIDF